MVRPTLALAVFALSLAAQDRQPGQGINFYSKEKEAALGAGLAAEFRKQTTALESPAVHDYIARLAAKLDGIDNRFSVITDSADNPLLEPHSFPGGYIFVSAALILAATDEAEFAGMLTHAMAHIAARHGTRMATRGQLVNLSSIPLIYMGSWSGLGGNSTLVPLGFLQSIRAFELEADTLAARMMAIAGYDPAALQRYIGRRQPADANPRNVYSTLPARDLRIAALEQIIRELPARTYSSSDEFTQIQEQIRLLR